MAFSAEEIRRRDPVKRAIWIAILIVLIPEGRSVSREAEYEYADDATTDETVMPGRLAS